jgi:hypothetical protein
MRLDWKLRLPALLLGRSSGANLPACAKRRRSNRQKGKKMGARKSGLHLFAPIFLPSLPNDPSSATAATRRTDCNRDGPPPFAAAHGRGHR